MKKIKQETLEEVKERYLYSPLPHSYKLAVEFGAKWQFDQNQEDINKLISIIEWYDNESDVRPDVEIFMWFEQFKKK